MLLFGRNNVTYNAMLIFQQIVINILTIDQKLKNNIVLVIMNFRLKSLFNAVEEER